MTTGSENQTRVDQPNPDDFARSVTPSRRASFELLASASQRQLHVFQSTYIDIGVRDFRAGFAGAKRLCHRIGRRSSVFDEKGAAGKDAVLLEPARCQTGHIGMHQMWLFRCCGGRRDGVRGQIC